MIEIAAINPPGWLQNAGATHTAEQMRNWHNLLLQGSGVASGSLLGRGGVNPSLGFELTTTQTGSPSMAIIVRAGHALIVGSEGSKQGVYSVMNDADTTISVTAAHATLARIDSVVFKVEDQQYSGSNNTSSLVVVAGTPSGSPVAPTLPNNALELARINVAAAVTSIVNANIVDTRVYYAATGGRILTTSTTRPAAGTVPVGADIYESDTNKIYVTPDSGTTWNQVYPGFTKISENILVAPAASITFSSIPQTYRTLQLHVITRGDTASQFISGRVRFNGDTAANYDSIQTSGSTSAAAFESLNATGADIGEIPGSTTVAGSAASYTIFIPFYTNTTFWKQMTISHMLSAQTSGGASGATFSKHWASRWRSTSAITSINIFPGSGNFITGSNFTLYGIV